MQTLHMPYRRKELQGMLADSSARAVILTNTDKSSRTADVLPIRGKLQSLEHIIVVGPPVKTTVALAELQKTTANSNDVIPTTADDTYLLLYTSGTTAAPKGVPHINRSFLNNALLSAHEMQINSDGRVLSLAALTHLYGLFTLHMSLASGGVACLIPAFNPESFAKDLMALSPSHIYAAPAHFAPFIARNLLKSEALDNTKLVCLSGAAVPVDLARDVDALMRNGGVIQLWGMSELQAGTFGRLTDPPEKRFSTAGPAVPKTELRVIDESGQVLASGQEGTLQVRGPSLFRGYLNRPDETARAFDDDGWFDTGDLAILDDDGFMSITGRIKELINRGGVKFNPIEVEEILNKLAQIEQCAIISVADPDLGERACLYVQLSPGTALTLDDVKAALDAAGMAKYKWPETLVILDELPLTPTRKVMRGTLIKLANNQED